LKTQALHKYGININNTNDTFRLEYKDQESGEYLSLDNLDYLCQQFEHLCIIKLPGVSTSNLPTSYTPVAIQPYVQQNTAPKNTSQSPTEVLPQVVLASSHNLSRIVGMPDETKLLKLAPLFGIADYQQMPLKAALKEIEPIVKGVEKYAKISFLQFATSQVPHGLDTDELVAINLYTLEWSSKPSSLYYILNERLRLEDRAQIKPFFPYLRVFLNALSKLPKNEGVVWRGVNTDISGNFKKDEQVFWWSFSSCTTDGDQLKTFFAGSAKCTLFMIHCHSGFCIHMFSNFPNEAEVLLPPLVLKVKNNFNVNQVNIIELDDLETPLVEL